MRNKVFLIMALALASLVFTAVASAHHSAPVPPSGWPSTTGSLSGDASGGCGTPVILSSDTAGTNGWSAFDFSGIPAGTTFSTLPVGALIGGDFDVLSGTQAQGEPYMIVRFTDGSQVFVYSVEINGAGTGTYFSTLAGNVYVNYATALSQYGSKTVKSVTLAVDNGNLTAAFTALSSNGCPVASKPAPPNTVFLCYSKFQETPGAWLFNEATALFDSGYWEPFAVAGNVDGGVNIDGFHLVCNTALVSTGYKLGDAGEIRPSSDDTGLGFAVIVK